MSFTYLSSLCIPVAPWSLNTWVWKNRSQEIILLQIRMTDFLADLKIYCSSRFSLFFVDILSLSKVCLTNTLRSTERYFSSSYVFSILLKGKTLPNDFVEMLSFVDPFKYNLYLAKPKTSNRITNAKRNFNFMLIWYIRLSFCL